MSGSTEGVGASWAGWAQADGVAVGDRCRVVANEGSHSHVRWLTGSRVGQYDLVPNEHLVLDSARVQWNDDAFALDAPSHRRVTVACATVLARAGEDALVAALEEQGLLAEAVSIITDAISVASGSLSSDPAWNEVASETGEHFGAIMSRAVRRACERAIEEASNVG